MARKGSNTARRRTRRVKKGGLTPLEDARRLRDEEIRILTRGTKMAFPPTQVRKTKKGGRTMRGGYYGFDGALATGAVNWGRSSEMGDFVTNSSRGGNNAILGAGRKRRGTKKSLRRTRRKMRGGGKYGGVSASFGGEGVAGIATYNGVTSRDNPGVPTGGKFNDYGAGPSSGFGSFVKAV